MILNGFLSLPTCLILFTFHIAFFVLPRFTLSLMCLAVATKCRRLAVPETAVNEEIKIFLYIQENSDTECVSRGEDNTCSLLTVEETMS